MTAHTVRSIFSGLLLSGLASGQVPPLPPIVTDRPAVTASSIVVPFGSLQAENGLADTVNYGQRTIDLPETLLRFGMLPKTELRLTLPNHFSPEGMGAGFGDPAIGLKQQLGPLHGLEASLVLSLTLPLGANAISSHGYDPSVQLPWSRTLSANWTIAGMLSVYWPTQAGRRNTTGQTTFLIGRQFTKTLDAFMEYVGGFPQTGGPRHLLHFGGAFKATPRQQLDFHFGFGQSVAAPDYLVGFGYSFRVQVFRR